MSDGAAVQGLDAAIRTALQHLPALLDVAMSIEVRSCDGTLSLARVPDPQAVQAWDTAEPDWRMSVPWAPPGKVGRPSHHGQSKR
ncbi:MAG: hypothetical protein KA141_07380 [Rubrivivax sp.]|nr:hypothetical protein [Rubrivivax sp.]